LQQQAIKVAGEHQIAAGAEDEATPLVVAGEHGQLCAGADFGVQGGPAGQAQGRARAEVDVTRDEVGQPWGAHCCPLPLVACLAAGSVT